MTVSPTLRRIAASLLAATAILHLVLVPEYLEEQPYIGVLFVLGGLTAGALAAALWLRDEAVAWGAGLVVALGMAVGFVLSRTTGLPGFHESEWELSGLVSVLLELGFAAIALPALMRRLPAGPRERPVGAR